MADMQTVELSVLVRPAKDITIDTWINFHNLKNMNRNVTLLGEYEDGYLVDISYTAKGADAADIMRPYRNTQEWRRLGMVERRGKSTTRRVDTKGREGK